jgi:hypothetical protein
MVAEQGPDYYLPPLIHSSFVHTFTASLEIIAAVLFQTLLYETHDGFTVLFQCVQCVLNCPVDGVLYVLTYLLYLAHTVFAATHHGTSSLLQN